jgi:hypothetical protein
MKIDSDRLTHFAPFAVPVLLLAGGWMLLVRPAAADSTRSSREADALRVRLQAVRSSISQPPPRQITVDPVAAFERGVPATDSSSQVLEQLARMAATASVANLLIETGDQVAVTEAPTTGPQVTGASPDPRFTMFGATLAYSPISMSFDADYTRAGELLWRLRGLPTAIEIRSLEIKPRVRADDREARSVNDGSVHVALSLFAYVRKGKVPGPAPRVPGPDTAGAFRASTQPGVSR